MSEPKFPPETLGEKIGVYTCIALLTVVPFIFLTMYNIRDVNRNENASIFKEL